jgi:hypothetical protein
MAGIGDRRRTADATILELRGSSDRIKHRERRRCNFSRKRWRWLSELNNRETSIRNQQTIEKTRQRSGKTGSGGGGNRQSYQQASEDWVRDQRDPRKSPRAVEIE